MRHGQFRTTLVGMEHTRSDACPFCQVADESIFYVSPLVIGLWDAFPVSPGHALLVPRRHVADWFEATPEEQAALTGAIAEAKRIIVEQYRPDGWNVGMNIGAAAGQTVFHLHIHVIPRYAGDVGNPRGGIRAVIRAKAGYPSGGKTGVPSG